MVERLSVDVWMLEIAGVLVRQSFSVSLFLCAAKCFELEQSVFKTCVIFPVCTVCVLKFFFVQKFLCIKHLVCKSSCM